MTTTHTKAFCVVFSSLPCVAQNRRSLGKRSDARSPHHENLQGSLPIPPRASQTPRYRPTHPCCTGWSCKITWVLVSSGFSPSFPSLGTTTTSPTGTLTSAFAISHMKPGGGGVPRCCRGQSRGRSVARQHRCLRGQRGRQRSVSIIAQSRCSKGRASGDRGAGRAKLRLQRGDQAV